MEAHVTRLRNVVGIMSRRRSLPWFPITITLIAAGFLIWIDLRAELERNLKGWLSMAIPLLTSALLVLWFFITPKFAGRTKINGLMVLICLGLAAKLALRVDGVIDGRGLPKLVWRWSSNQQALAESALPMKTAAARAEDPRLKQAADVPEFFGARRDGTVPDIGLSTDWQKDAPKQLWRQPIGAGWSAFSVQQGRAYTQEQRGEEELVTCYELLTGRLLWLHADRARFTQWQGGDGPRATPTVHEGRVYAYGATGILNCLDALTGLPIWQRRVLQENEITNIEWGICASPLIVDDKVIVTGGQNQGPVLFAYLLQSGAPVWKAGFDQASYASPMLATLDGRRVILSNNARSLTANDPASGDVLLDHAWGGDKWPKASQPVVISANQVFVSAGYGMGCLLLEIRAEPNGKLAATELWMSMKMKTQFNSPALLDGHLYCLDDGRLSCLNVSKGERLWKEGRFASGQSLLVGKHVIIQNESGPVHLCAAQPTGFVELGRLGALSSKTWNHPVLAGRYLLLRNDREAVCYELPIQK
jgi:outer membrane protein assembly factor BamB